MTEDQKKIQKLGSIVQRLKYNRAKRRGTNLNRDDVITLIEGYYALKRSKE